VSDVSACQSATTSFTQQVNAVNTESAAYSQAGISAFPAYVATMNRYASNLQSTGTAYTAAYAKVLSDLSPLLGSNLAGLSTIYADLLGLQVSGSVSGVEGSLGQATSAMATVQADIDAYANAVATQDSLIVMQPELLGSAASVASSAQAYLDAAGASAMANASVSVQAVSHAAQLFVASANSSTSLEVGFFGSAEQSLASSGTALVAQTSACARAVATAGTYIDADIDSRVADSVTAQGDVASALQLFSSLDIGGGVSAMAQASLEFQAASAAGAP
ncbi:MAG TPA: hypothetical protein VJR06_08155, partial [Nitrososphaerales archaeon]|nr:hypothetical protein [Nitrososphaerales archaeon]